MKKKNWLIISNEKKKITIKVVQKSGGMGNLKTKEERAGEIN